MAYELLELKTLKNWVCNKHIISLLYNKNHFQEKNICNFDAFANN